MERMDGAARAGARLLRRLLPAAERDEVMADLAAEYAARTVAAGRARATWWLWRQVLRSAVPLVMHRVWRGWRGFEPASDRFHGRGSMLETWVVDARYAVRRLVHRPLYATLAVLTLALGVGGTAAIFGITRELLLSPLPIAREQEVMLWWQGGNWRESELLHLRSAGIPGFEAVAAYGVEDVRLGGDGGMRVVPAVRTSAELFEVLGVRPQLGGGFAAGDDAVGAESKVVLSHGLWRALGSDAGIIGQRIDINGSPRTVAGVMPPGFWFPDPSVRLWVTQGFSPTNHSGWYTLIGRLTPGQTAGEVDNALALITGSLGAQFDYPEEWDNTRDAHLTPVRERILGPARPTLVATLVAMAVILLMACANVAALMLGQMEARGTELSVRSALGAGRARLMQQLVAEGVALGIAAGLAGAAVAAGAFGVLRAALPLGALAERASLDWSVFWFSLLLAIGAALVIALIPVISVLRADLRDALTSGRTAGIAGRGGRLENGLVIAEVALAVVVAAGAALLVRSVANLRSVETGLDPRSVAVVDIIAPAELTHAGRGLLVAELVRDLGSMPGAAAAGATQRLPLRGSGDNWGLEIEGRGVLGVTTSFRMVTHDYLDVMRGRLLRGRWFDAGDRADSERVVVINESLARQHFGSVDPLGQRTQEFGEWSRIIGVIADIQERGLTDEPAPARYVLLDQSPWIPARHALVVRTAAGVDALAVAAAARDVVRRTAPTVGVQEVTTMARVMDRALGPAKQLMSLLGLLAGLALFLGGIGVYGVVSHFVQRRRRDWGIRMALGFRPAQVVGHVAGRGALLVSGGIIIGLVVALAGMRVLDAFVYGIGTADAGALAAAALALLAVGVAGALVPALRASRVDPARVLREQ